MSEALRRLELLSLCFVRLALESKLTRINGLKWMVQRRLRPGKQAKEWEESSKKIGRSKKQSRRAGSDAVGTNEGHICC